MTVTINNFAAGGSAKVYESVNGAAPAAAADVSISAGAIAGCRSPQTASYCWWSVRD
jgi:hypothetical protein